MNDEKFDEVLDTMDDVVNNLADVRNVVIGVAERMVRTETRLSKLMLHLGLRADGTAPLAPLGNDK